MAETRFAFGAIEELETWLSAKRVRDAREAKEAEDAAAELAPREPEAETRPGRSSRRTALAAARPAAESPAQRRVEPAASGLRFDRHGLRRELPSLGDRRDDRLEAFDMAGVRLGEFVHQPIQVLAAVLR